MADHNLPTIATAYSVFLSSLSDRIKDAMLGNDPANVTVTNPPTGAIRWNSSSIKWEKYNGTAWAVLASLYAISISGNAATATLASGVTFANVTGKPTTLAGYGITDAAPIASPNFSGTPQLGGIPLGYLGIPGLASAAVAAAGAAGKVYIQTGNHAPPAGVFNAYDTYAVYNSTNGNLLIIPGSGLTMRLVGTNLGGTRTLAQRGFATIWYVSSAECVISGGGVS